MQFDSVSAIWTMGGHGPFVWSAYAIAAAILIAIIVAPLQRRRRFFIEQRGIARRNEARAQHNSTTDSQAR